MTDALFEVAQQPAYDWNAYDRRIAAANDARARLDNDALRRKPSTDYYWSEQAEWWMKTLVYGGDIITADDLIREVGLPTGSANQVGARFRKWCKAGMITPVGYVQSTRPAGHGRAVRQWRKA